MLQMFQCLVNYFGVPADEQGRPLRYYSYQVVAGPGPAEGSGAATITLLAAGDPHGVYQIFQNFHVVQEGGAAAAIEKAVHYLDAFHSEDRLRKIRTEQIGHASTPFPASDKNEHAPSSRGPQTTARSARHSAYRGRF